MIGKPEAAPCRSSRWQVEPNIRPKPRNRKTITLIEKSRKFFMMMLMLFFARENPNSTMAKPACMRKTSAAVATIQSVFTLTCTVSMSAFGR
jgi:hypothetical protein